MYVPMEHGSDGSYIAPVLSLGQQEIGCQHTDWWYIQNDSEMSGKLIVWSCALSLSTRTSSIERNCYSCNYGMSTSQSITLGGVFLPKIAADDTPTSGHQRYPVRGMIPVDEDSTYCLQSTVRNLEVSNGGNRRDSNRERIDLNQDRPDSTQIKKEESNSWRKESKSLLKDYEHRFHRKFLTEQAEVLLDRAFACVRGNVLVDEINKNTDAMGICSEALLLCKTAIDDQQETANRNDFVGGSYLVSGDIRLRRKGEGLASKIYCLRASLRFQEGHYEESLEDCESAISIWNQKYSSRRKKVFFIGNRPKPNAYGNKDRSPTIEPRARKASHKYLFLLKARNLTAMGRYKEAAMWLTHPDKLPTRTFQRSSAILETDVAMNRFLEKTLLHGGDFACKPGSTVHYPAGIARSPTSKRLWPNLLYSIDRRLNEGMPGKFRTTKKHNSGEKSNSANAIYHLLRHGPVLFQN